MHASGGARACMACVWKCERMQVKVKARGEGEVGSGKGREMTGMNKARRGRELDTET